MYCLSSSIYVVGTPDQAAIVLHPVANAVHVIDSGGVTAEGEGFGSLGGYLGIAREVDIPVHQARFDVTVYELNVSNDLKLGLDYIAWKNGPGADLWRFVLAGAKVSTRDRVDLGGVVGDVVTHTHTSVSQEFFSSHALITAGYLDFLRSKGQVGRRVSPYAPQSSPEWKMGLYLDQPLT